VAQVASSDLALAASLIRTVNSSASGLNRKITSISEAVSYLGFCIVKSMVIRLRLDEVMAAKTEAGAQDAEDLWVHSLAVSYAAEQLATRVNDVDRGFVATLGLLHDVGKLAIVSQLPADALRLNAEPNDTSENSLARERRLLGVDHAGIGADLAAKWKLPSDLIQAIRWHHRASEAFLPTDPPALRKALHIVQIANQLAKYCHCYADRVDIDVIPDEVFDLLGLERSMPKLLDDKMRSAISRAIYFADSSSKRATAAPRRFLRPLRGEAAARVGKVDTGAVSRIRSDEQAIASMFAADIALVDLNSARPPKLTSGPARFICQATVPGVEKCINAVLSSPDLADLTADTRSSITIVIRSLLPNLLRLSSPSETIEVCKQPRGRGMAIAVRNAGLSFARRIPNYSPESARRVSEAELANVLNLGWFKQIVVSTDGTTMMFASE
jgi:putative nucleotidyltransferase with HDIG domain